MPGATLPGDCASARPEEGLTVTESESIKRTLPLRIAAAVVVVCLLAVGGWVFGETRVALDTVWVIATALLVFFMNRGFATVTIPLVRQRGARDRAR